MYKRWMLRTNMTSSNKKISDKEISQPIKCEDLLTHVRGLQENRGFEREFRKIPIGETGKITHAKKPNADEKNRYYFIFPFDHNRVKLDTSTKPYVCEGDDYINASYSKSYNGEVYITAQAPLQDYISEFWQMIWEQDCPRIVMLANLIDDGHINCDQYWPDEGTEEMDDFTVTNCGEEVCTYYIKRNLQVSKAGETKSVTQYQYTCWPDRGVPATCASILQLRAATVLNPVQGRGPTILHCSAGIGRTGTFLAIDYLIQQAQQENQIDLMACTHFLRKSRMNMIQNLAQYAYVYETVLEAIVCQPGVAVSCEDYIRNNIQYKANLGRVTNQYEVLECVRERDIMNSCTEGQKPGNTRRNRDPQILPRDFAMLSLAYLEGKPYQYINAIFVAGYSDPYDQLVTQMPLPHTVLDLWRLVADYNVTTVVMLNPTQADSQYWPLEAGQSMEISDGLYSVTNSKCTVADHLHTTDITLSYRTADIQKSQHIKHFHFEENIAENLLHHPEFLLQLYQTVITERASKEGEFLIHCLNGCELSGIFTCIDHIVKRIDREQMLDLFNAVKYVRRSRPQFITSIEQYKCLWEIAELYLQQKTSYQRS